MKTTGALTFRALSGLHMPVRLPSTTTMSASMSAAEGALSAAAAHTRTAQPKPGSRSHAAGLAFVTTRIGLAVGARGTALVTADGWMLFAMAVNIGCIP